MDKLAAGWQPDTFKTLFGLLSEAATLPQDLSDPVAADAAVRFARHLQSELTTHRATLLAVLQLPSGPDAAHRRRVREEKVAEINGVPHQLTDDFCAEVIRLSDFLRINEYLAATLIQHGMHYSARFDRPPAETGAVLFATETLYKFATLEAVLKLALDTEACPPVRQVCDGFLIEYVVRGSVGAASQSSTAGNWWASAVDPSIQSAAKKEPSPYLTPWLDALVAYRSEITQWATRLEQARSLPTSSHPTASQQQQQQQQPMAQETALPYGPAIVDELVGYLERGRITLANTLFLAVHYRSSGPADFLVLARHLQSHAEAQDPATIYVLMAALATAAVDESTEGGGDSGHGGSLLAAAASRTAVETLAVGPVGQVNDFLVKDTCSGWGSSGAMPGANGHNEGEFSRGVWGLLTLQWSQYLLVHLHRFPSLETALSIREESIEQWVDRAISADVFGFATRYCLAFKRVDRLRYTIGDDGPTMNFSAADWRHNNQAMASAKATYPTARLDPEFQQHLCHQMAASVTGLIANMSSILRRIRYREEDSYLHRPQGVVQPSAGRPGVPPPATHAVVDFFNLIATLYTDVPDLGLRFWRALSPASLPLTQTPLPTEVANGGRLELVDERLHIFLRWAADCRAPSMIRAYLDMLGSLATGPACAQYAYVFFGANSPSAHTGGGAGRNGGGGSGGLCSWSALFAALQFYADQLRKANAASNETTLRLGGSSGAADSAGAPMFEIPPDEAAIIAAFLRLLRQTVTYSAAVREALYDHGQYRALYTLFDLLGCRVPVTLKAEILAALAAFCAAPSDVVVIGGGDVKTSGDAGAVEIARQAWQLLELSQTIPTVVDPQRLASALAARPLGAHGPPAGYLYELEEVEATKEIYPETLAFVRFLATLIHVPVPASAGSSSSAAVRSGAGVLAGTCLLLPDGVSSPSLPTDLGANHRLPGVAPYVNAILDHVFLKADLRGYRDPADRWEVAAVCLDLVERCLITLDLVSLVRDPALTPYISGTALDLPRLIQSFTGGPGAPSATTTTGQLPEEFRKAFRATVLHPGFDILIRLLTGSPLLDEILKVVVANPVDVLNATGSSAGGAYSGTADNSNNGGAATNGSATSDAPLRAVRLALRVLLRVLHLQHTVLHALFPLLAHPWVTAQLELPTLQLPPGLVALDQLLLYRYPAVIQMTLYVNCRVNEELCLLSVELLGRLAASPVFGTDGPTDTLAAAPANRLVALLDGSDESLRILFGYLERLETADPEPADSTQSADGEEGRRGSVAVANTLTTATDTDRLVAPVDANTIRAAIVDLLLANLSPDRGCPSVAHWLLGFDTGSSATVRATVFQAPPTSGAANTAGASQITSASSIHARMACLHVILDALRAGTHAAGWARRRDDHAEQVDEAEVGPTASLWASHPAFATRCYHLVYRLCADPHTGPPVRKYLREAEDFIPRQLALARHAVTEFVAPILPPAFGSSGGLEDDLMNTGGGDLAELRRHPGWTLLARTAAWLHQRAWFLRTVALELRMLADEGSRSRALRLLHGLFRGEAPATSGALTGEEGSATLTGFPAYAALRRAWHQSPSDDPAERLWDLSVAARTPDTHSMPGADVRAVPAVWWFYEFYVVWSQATSFLARAEAVLAEETTGSGGLESSSASFAAGHISEDPADYFSLPLDAHLRPDDQGAPTYDLPAICLQLRGELTELERRGALPTPAHRHAAQVALGRLLRIRFVGSQRLRLAHAHGHVLRAWQQVVEVALTGAFDYLGQALLGEGDDGGPLADPTANDGELGPTTIVGLSPPRYQPAEPLVLALTDAVLTRFALATNESAGEVGTGPTGGLVDTLGSLLAVLTAKLRDGQPQRLAALAAAVIQDDTSNVQPAHRQGHVNPGSSGDAPVEAQFPVAWTIALWDRLVPCVLEAGVPLHLRGQLYAALLGVLRYAFAILGQDTTLRTHRCRSAVGELGRGDSTESARHHRATRGVTAAMVTTATPDPSPLARGLRDVVIACGDPLLEAVCRDASDAPDVWRTVAFALLDHLVRCVEPGTGGGAGSNRMVTALAQRTYLRHMVSVLKRDELALARALQPGADNLNPLYVHEAKLHFFLRVASRREGVERFVENGLIAALDASEVLELRPAQGAHPTNHDDGGDDLRVRYHQVFYPVLQLLTALVDRAGKDRPAVAVKVAQYLAHHRRTYEVVVASPLDAGLAGLREADRFTALLLGVCRAVPPASLPTDGRAVASDLGGLAGPVLALLPQLRARTVWQPLLHPLGDRDVQAAGVSLTRADGDTTRFGELATAAVQSTVRNVLALAIHLAGTPGTPAGWRPVFSWSLTALGDGQGPEVFGGALAASKTVAGTPATIRPPTLGALIVSLSDTLRAVIQLSAFIDRLSHHRADPTRMSSEDVTAILSGAAAAVSNAVTGVSGDAADALGAELPLAQRQLLAATELRRQLTEAHDRRRVLVDACESALYLLWSHLAFYLRRGDKGDDNGGTISAAAENDASQPSAVISISEVFARLTPPPVNYQPDYRLEAIALLQPVVNQLREARLIADSDEVLTNAAIAAAQPEPYSPFAHRTARKLAHLFQV